LPSNLIFADVFAGDVLQQRRGYLEAKADGTTQISPRTRTWLQTAPAVMEHESVLGLKHRYQRIRSVTSLFASFVAACPPRFTPFVATRTSLVAPLHANGLGFGIGYRQCRG
jgi:hypothetical protein